MNGVPFDKRKEFRSLIQIGATIKIHASGRSALGTTIDMTSAGALLRLDEPLDVEVGDKVTCDFEVTDAGQGLLPYWGVGQVTRVDGAILAVQLNATGLTQQEPLT